MQDLIYRATVSDLFFNTDHSDALIKDSKGNFSHYDDDLMMAEAETFVEQMKIINVVVPSPREMIKDFYDRL